MSESDHGLTRRQFLGLTGGLIISFTIPARFATAAGLYQMVKRNWQWDRF